MKSWQRLQRYNFFADRAGSLGPTVALAAVALVGTAGLSIDYLEWTRQETELQAAADVAAMSATSEGPLHGWDTRKLTSIAEAFVQSNLQNTASSTQPHATRVNVDKVAKRVEVQVVQTGRMFFAKLFRPEPPQIRVSATATLHGEASICVLALDTGAARSISLGTAATVVGNGCAVFSNSANRKSVVAEPVARLTAATTCTAGGYQGLPLAFSPVPTTDCPRVPDPLHQRKLQDTGGCLHTDLAIDVGFRRLAPGTYCGQTRVSDGASVSLDPGVYTFTDGELLVEDASVLQGSGITLQFKGEQSGFVFDQTTKVSLSAPSTGSTAGLLIFADRQSDDRRRFHIMSSDAERMIGALYLPTGEIIVGGDINLDGICDLLNGIVPSTCKVNVGQQSHWTAIVAKVVTTSFGANVVLNTDFSASDVPAPDGIGGKVRLLK